MKQAPEEQAQAPIEEVVQAETAQVEVKKPLTLPNVPRVNVKGAIEKVEHTFKGSLSVEKEMARLKEGYKNTLKGVKDLVVVPASGLLSLVKGHPGDATKTILEGVKTAARDTVEIGTSPIRLGLAAISGTAKAAKEAPGKMLGALAFSPLWAFGKVSKRIDSLWNLGAQINAKAQDWNNKGFQLPSKAA